MDDRSKEIHNEMLNDISDNYEKVEGSFIFDATGPAAIKISDAEKKQEEVRNKLSIDNLSGDELAQRIYDRTGISRRDATFSIGSLSVEGDGTIQIGDRFETSSGVPFEAIETVTISGSGTVDIQALQAGTVGNVPADQITQIPVTLDGITSVTNPEATHDGFPAESDDDLLQRYYDRIQTPSTSGNRFHYLNWSKEVAGVGDAKVFPLWNGNNTVKVVLINSERLPASDELVSSVQEYLDPGITGLGEGEAPIGAFVTVASATEKTIDVAFTVTLESGFDQESADQEVTQLLIDHLKSIAFQQDFVSYAKIGALILGSESIADYTDLTVNGGTNNVTISPEEVAVLGGVTIA